MTQAIITKYIGPTATKSARVKASCEAGAVTIPWDHGRTVEGNHKEVIYALLGKVGWMYPNDDGKWHYGWLGDRMVAVRGD